MGYNGLVELTKAVALYNVLSKHNSSVLPEIRPSLQKTLALWLIKKRADSARGWMDWFKALCASVITVAETSHCASFCHANHNVATESHIPEDAIHVMGEFLEYIEKDNVDKVKEMLRIQQQNDNDENEEKEVDKSVEVEDEEGSVFTVSRYENSDNGSLKSQEEHELQTLTENEA